MMTFTCKLREPRLFAKLKRKRKVRRATQSPERLLGTG